MIFRLTPLYAYLILFSIGLYRYCGAGPYWQATADAYHDYCSESWWANLLYINVIYPSISSVSLCVFATQGRIKGGATGAIAPGPPLQGGPP